MTNSNVPSATRCPKCAAENLRDNNYCGKCGTPLDSATATVVTYLDANLKDLVNEVLKDRFREQSVVETELSAKVAEKVSTWAKLFGLYVGVPLIAASAYLAWVGFDVNKSLTLLQQKLNETKKSGKELDELLGSTKKSTDGLVKQSDDLKRKITESSALLEKIPALATTVGQLNDRISAVAAPLLLEFKTKGQAIGIDATRHDGPLQATKLKEAGLSFVFLKATEGNTFRDPLFVENCKAVHDAGLACGAYHVLRGGDPERQATNYITAIKAASLDLPPAVTFEPAVSGKDATLEDLKVFVAALERGYGCTPVVYGGTYLRSQAASADKSLARYPLWLAQYSPIPRVMAPWSDWTFWQFTDRLPLGSLGAFDVNVFNGRLPELKEFAAKACPSSRK